MLLRSPFPRLILLLLLAMMVAAHVPGIISTTSPAKGLIKQRPISSATGPGMASSAPDLDQYGGLMALSSSNGGSGFFRVEKFDKRWLLVTPSGHAFWMLSVQNIGDYFFRN